MLCFRLLFANASERWFNKISKANGKALPKLDVFTVNSHDSVEMNADNKSVLATSIRQRI